MAAFERALLDLGHLDRLAYQDTWVHRLDPRAKLLATLVYLLCVVSFGKYEISALLPFALFPVVLATEGNVPFGYLARKIVAVVPFAFFVGIFNPLVDRQVQLQLGPLAVSGGWLSFASILLRVALTVGAALVLIATTSFHGVCAAAERLGAPQAFAVQLLFLYRYVFVLGDEAFRLVRARALRSFQGRGMGIGVFAQIVGNLLLRTMARAQRIHLAMRCRGFDGEIRTLRRLSFGRAECSFLVCWSAAFAALRLYNLPQLVGRLVTEFGR